MVRQAMTRYGPQDYPQATYRDAPPPPRDILSSYFKPPASTVFRSVTGLVARFSLEDDFSRVNGFGAQYVSAHRSGCRVCSQASIGKAPPFVILTRTDLSVPPLHCILAFLW